MSSSRSSIVARLAVVAAALMLAACQTTTYETASDTNLTPRDKALLAKARYAKAEIPQPYRRAIVNYHRKETPGTIVIDSDNHYLYLVQDNGKALRYGVTVGEEALAFSGIAKVGNKQEWPRWIPTPDIHKRIEGLPKQVEGGPDNPLGARGLYLYQGGKDTLFRIHGTNQPSTIGQFVSSRCIGMLNEDVTDLFERTKVGTRVVVLPGGKPPALSQPVTASAQPYQGGPAPAPMANGAPPPRPTASMGVPNQGPTVVPPLPAPVTVR